MGNSNCISFCELCVLASRGVIMYPGLSMRVVKPIVSYIPDLICKKGGLSTRFDYTL